jgi:arylsulfatase A-like enzyme
MLLGRYHRAIELMDEKLARFYDAARGAGLLDDTLLIVTSDHGEAFGDHELYFHDASVYDTHLRVPLWIHHPDLAPAVVDDVVSTRDLFGLIRAAGLGEGVGGTLLAGDHRRAHPVALAEHFHYPHTEDLLARYTQNLTAAVVGTRKVIVRHEGLEHYDLGADPVEAAPAGGTVADFEAACRRDGFPPKAIAAAAAHLRRACAGSDRSQVRVLGRTSPEVRRGGHPPLADGLAARESG